MSASKSRPPGLTAELLAPAGDLNALQAALAVGADAVYLGLDSWSARAFAGNFTGRELIKAIERAHLYGARAHLALNTLLKDDELQLALAALEGPYEAGLDALIVADLGFAALVRGTYPDLPLHASTQLNTHSSAQLKALAERGFTRAILAREMSLAEIERLNAHGLELEVFVHGALCYGYSGLCLFSSMVGGRSGNRGRCSQACRMRYRLLAGERGTDFACALSEVKVAKERGAGFSRTLSTNDLAAIDVLPQLLRAGVTSFKIEGRMKDAAYVGTATAVYRQALDAALADPDHYEVRSEWLRRLEQSFSRGFTNAHLEGDHARVRSRGRSGHRGVAVGRVESVDEARGLVTVRLTAPLEDNDVVSIYTPAGQTEPQRVAAVRVAGGGAGKGKAPAGGANGAAKADRVTLHLAERVAVKDRLFRLSSAEIDAFAQAAVAGRYVLRPLPLHARLEGTPGVPARLILSMIPSTESSKASLIEPAAAPLAVSAESLVVTVVGDEPLREARTAPLSADKARVALGALGGTPYELADLDFAVDGSVFIAVGALKDLRRRALVELDQQRLAARRREAVPGIAAVKRSAPAGSRHSASQPAVPAPKILQTIVRLACDDSPSPVPGVSGWCLDLTGDEAPRLITNAIARLRGLDGEVRCRPPEILFDSDEAWWRKVAKLSWDAVYARHLSHLEADLPAIVEYPLQGLNAEVARRLRPRAVVASPEASLDEIAYLAGALDDLDPPAAVEVVAFARQELLITRDRLGVVEGLVPDLSPGSSPTDPPALSLVDGKGFVFRAVVDSRGTRIANARVTNLTGKLRELAAAGVGTIIVDIGDMSSAERNAFAAHGVAGLAAFAGRERSTTGHLFRGVA